MKDIRELLREKEMECSRVQRQIDALRLVIPLLEGQPLPEDEARKQPESERIPVPVEESTGTEGPKFSSVGEGETSFWKRRW